MLGFLPPWPIGAALVVGVLFPAPLWLTRFIPGIAGNPSLRYLAACGLAVAAWIGLLGLGPAGAGLSFVSPLHLVNGLLVLLAAFVISLGLWGLLTRGCSISILLALSTLPGRTTAEALGALYSGGRGLDWLTRKRVNSLTGAGLATSDGHTLRVAVPRGSFILRLHALIAAALGLKSIG